MNIVNPFYIALTPLAYVARLSHQLPMFLNPKRNEVLQDKYNMVSLPPDVNFVKDRWQSFQYIEWRFSEKWNCDECRQRSDDWCMNNFKCKSNFIANEGSSVKQYIETITRKKPSEVIKNSTHLIVYFNNILIAFMDHYFCDGIVLADFIKHMFKEEKLSNKVFPKYKNYPFISDYMAIEFTGRTFFDSLKYPSQIKDISEKTHTMTEIFRKTNDIAWNRWTIYAHGSYRIFESVSDVDYLRIGLTVGFDSDKMFGNNRIGMIIVIIKRPPHNSTYNEKIMNLMEQFENQTMTRSYDANTSYDIIRGYDIGFIRKSKMKRVIDIYFTSLFFKEENTHNVTGVGGFIGAINNTEFTYISALTFGTLSHFTYVSNWKQMNLNALTSSGVTIDYEFDNQDPNQF
jgi:hypothetical protein